MKTNYLSRSSWLCHNSPIYLSLNSLQEQKRKWDWKSNSKVNFFHQLSLSIPMHIPIQFPNTPFSLALSRAQSRPNPSTPQVAAVGRVLNLRISPSLDIALALLPLSLALPGSYCYASFRFKSDGRQVASTLLPSRSSPAGGDALNMATPLLSWCRAK